MKKIESISVPKLDSTERLSDYLVGKLETITTRKGVKKAIARRLVKVNGRVGHSGDYINGGEFIELFRPKDKEKIHLDVEVPVLYEDEHLAVVYKPSGVIVSGNMKRTLVNTLPTILNESSEKDALQNPHAVHRLDQVTSGVMLIGKTRNSVVLLNQLFADRKVTKTYHAVAIGTMEDSGVVDTPIKTKESKTSYRRLQHLESEKYNGLNLLEVQPETGRRHQIRIHLSELGCPILGDKEYGIKGKISKGNGIYLHATSLEFVHPITSEALSIKSEVPIKFGKLFGEVN